MSHSFRVWVDRAIAALGPRDRLCAVAACALIVFPAMRPTAWGQCETGWEPGVLTAPHLGANGPVNAIIEWGLPAQPLKMIVAGSFTEIGGIAANNIAAWDGAKWQALGEGVSDAVYSLAVYNFALVAGGRGFVKAWNGSTWVSYGSPDSGEPGVIAKVHALTIFNGYLYAGGDFVDISPGFGSGSCMYFDGSNWHDTDLFNTVYALQVFDDDGAGSNPPALYIGGREGFNFNNFRKSVDGVTTVEIEGVDGDIFTMTVVNAMGGSPGGLIIGGDFTWIRRVTDPDIEARNVIGWTGSSWFSLGGGVGAETPPFDAVGWVSALRAYGSFLYVGGSFAAVHHGTISAINLARWNGNAWSDVDGGVGTTSLLATVVQELRVVNGTLVAGGSFGSAAGGSVPANHVAQWNGVNWSAFNEYPSVQAAAYLGSRVVIGGRFSYWTQAGPFDPPVNRYNVLTWDGVNVGGAGWGTNGPVNAMVGYVAGSGISQSNNLIVGGAFTVAGGGFEPGGSIAVNNVAHWTEPTLTPARWQAMGSGFNGTVYALDRYNSSTVAGGAFTASGATTLNRLAKWNGSAWQPLTTTDIGLNGAVYAMKTYTTNLGTNFHLVIGGDFTSAPGSGVAATRILQRSEGITGSSWVALGAGFNATVLAIERHANATYAAGSFTHSGGTLVNRIARWTGSAWVPVGTGAGFNGPVYALKSAGGYLYASGIFTSVDGVAVNNVARWNGTAWSEVAGGANAPIFAMLPYKTELIVGGAFTAVQSSSIPTTGMARHLVSGLPWLTSQPISQVRPCGQLATFSVSVVEGYDVVTYQWRHNGIPLNEGLTPHGSFLSGVGTDTLSIQSPREPDDGAYDCLVSNACGSITSSAATLTVEACCIGDTNFDGLVNVTDLLILLAGWGPNPGHPADFNHDGTVNVSDLLTLLAAWGAC